MATAFFFQFPMLSFNMLMMSSLKRYTKYHSNALILKLKWQVHFKHGLVFYYPIGKKNTAARQNVKVERNSCCASPHHNSVFRMNIYLDATITSMAVKLRHR